MSTQLPQTRNTTWKHPKYMEVFLGALTLSFRKIAPEWHTVKGNSTDSKITSTYAQDGWRQKVAPHHHTGGNNRILL
ncbi:hypothetical protein TNCV_3826191 [Trichonephila clavipes]|nr:hypothetical protein TNCV_3826191 [Trichonephila clavipes]